jgi:putative transposase
MDGRGLAKYNIFIERLWRSLKYEYAYLNPAGDGLELYQGLQESFKFYNHDRHHQKLGNQIKRNTNPVLQTSST